MPIQEVVEAEGHLIDSHIMETIFDKVVEYHGRFEVEQFRIGRTNSDPSYLRLKVETPDDESLKRLLNSLLELGCAPVNSGDAILEAVERDHCAPLDFYSTTNHRTYVRIGTAVDRGGKSAHGRHDRGTRRPRVLPPAARPPAGRPGSGRAQGIRVIPESKERDRLDFAFMSNGISSERQVETAVRQTAALLRHAIGQKLKVIAVAGPVVVHTGGVEGLSRSSARVASTPFSAATRSACTMWRRRFSVRRSAFAFRTAARRSTAIAITCARSTPSNHAGSVKQAVETGVLKSGVLYECIKAGVPFVLAGSLRDDGALPDTITDMNAAQDAYAQQLKGAGLVLCLGSMLHSIATGNMLPSWVKIVCVDINPAVATKVSDRGTGQAVGVVTDVGLFLDILSKALA